VIDFMGVETFTSNTPISRPSEAVIIDDPVVEESEEIVEVIEPIVELVPIIETPITIEIKPLPKIVYDFNKPWWNEFTFGGMPMFTWKSNYWYYNFETAACPDSDSIGYFQYMAALCIAQHTVPKEIALILHGISKLLKKQSYMIVTEWEQGIFGCEYFSCYSNRSLEEAKAFRRLSRSERRKISVEGVLAGRFLPVANLWKSTHRDSGESANEYAFESEINVKSKNWLFNLTKFSRYQPVPAEYLAVVTDRKRLEEYCKS
jgi:hypothetical protein